VTVSKIRSGTGSGTSDHLVYRLFPNEFRCRVLENIGRAGFETIIVLIARTNRKVAGACRSSGASVFLGKREGAKTFGLNKIRNDRNVEISDGDEFGPRSYYHGRPEGVHRNRRVRR